MRSIVSSQLSVFNYWTASNRIESPRIESYWIVFYQHASFLVSYRAHVSIYESDRFCFFVFDPKLLCIICFTCTFFRALKAYSSYLWSQNVGLPTWSLTGWELAHGFCRCNIWWKIAVKKEIKIRYLIHCIQTLRNSYYNGTFMVQCKFVCAHPCVPAVCI